MKIQFEVRNVRKPKSKLKNTKLGKIHNLALTANHNETLVHEA